MLIVRKRPTLLKLLCGIAVVVGLFVCIIPTIFPSVDPKAEKTKTENEAHGVSRVLWPLVFMLGFVSKLYIKLFRQRLSHKSVKGAFPTMLTMVLSFMGRENLALIG